MKKVFFAAFFWGFSRLTHTILYIIREQELDNPEDFEEISDNTWPLIITVIDLVFTELLCYYFVLNSAFVRIFVPNETVSASIPLMIRPRKDSYFMELSDTPSENIDLVIQKEIFNQRGKLGVLYQGQVKGNSVIVRRISLNRVNNYVLEKLQQDVNELQNIANPYLLTNIKLIIKKPTIDLVMPFINGGSLFSALHEKGFHYSLKEKLEIGKELALCLKLIHTQGRAHGHLSSHNVLLDTDSIYISDIGLEHLKKYAGVVRAYCNKNS